MLFKVKSLLTFLLLLGAALAAQERFDDHRVYRVRIEQEKQRLALDTLPQILSTPANYWKGSNQLHLTADIMIAPEDQHTFESLLVDNDFKWTLMVKNVQQLIDAEQPKNIKPRAEGELNWVEYHTFETIMDWMDNMLAQHADILSDVQIGSSVEGRPVRGLKLSKKSGNPAILIEATTHAREWIAAATATYFINELLTTEDEDLLALSENYDWIIVPVHNPDGYVYSMESNRMWRKNRSRHALICLGTDPNRNWGYEWATNVEGSSDNPCADTFTGPHAFSEPETKSLADYITANEGYIRMFLSFHSFGQYILYPFSYTSDPTPDVELFDEVSKVAVDAIKEVHGTQYVAQASNALYPHHGTSVDWVYGHAGIKMAFTFEFRDTGKNGFILPATEIIPNADEAIAGVKALVQIVAEKGLI